MRAALFLLPTLVLLCGCEHAAERRWDVMTPASSLATPAKAPKAVVSGYATPDDDKAEAPKPSSKKPALKDLSDHGQGSYLSGLAQVITAEGKGRLHLHKGNAVSPRSLSQGVWGRPGRR